MRIGTTCKILILLVIYLGLTACVSSTKTARSSPYILNKASSLGSLKSTTSDTAIDISKVETPDGDLWDDFRGNIELNSYANKREVIAQIHWYQNHQQYLNRSLMRGSPYLYYIYQETQKRHLPAELALVPLNESAYDPFLFSKAGATGLWQMMPGTASGFGLKINWWYDGRRDVVASTNAALKYLTYLHYYFNDWLLAIAAYNSGEGTVQAAVLHNKRHNLPTDFWSLPLPKETRGYVPKLLALAEIFKNPDEYGIKLLPVNSAPYFEQVDVGSQLELNQAASLAGVSAAAMHTLNPGYRRWAMDPDGPYKLLIPAASVDSFKQRLDNLPEHARVHWKKHLVTRNETPKSIAQKYHRDLIDSNMQPV